MRNKSHVQTLKDREKRTSIRSLAHKEFLKDNIIVTRLLTYSGNHIYLSKTNLGKLLALSEVKWTE